MKGRALKDDSLSREIKEADNNHHILIKTLKTKRDNLAKVFAAVEEKKYELANLEKEKQEYIKETVWGYDIFPLAISLLQTKAFEGKEYKQLCEIEVKIENARRELLMLNEDLNKLRLDVDTIESYVKSSSAFIENALSLRQKRVADSILEIEDLNYELSVIDAEIKKTEALVQRQNDKMKKRNSDEFYTPENSSDDETLPSIKY